MPKLFIHLLMTLNLEHILSESPVPFVQVLCPVEQNKQKCTECLEDSIIVTNFHVTHF